MKQIFTSILIVTIFVGCGTASKKDKPVTNSSNQSLVLPQPYAPVAGTLPSTNPISTAPVNTAPASTTVQASGLNPAHGQPGHVCELGVGAPLNKTAPQITPATNANQTVTMSEPVFTTTGKNPPSLNFNPPAASTVTAPGINPPHGQPGHRCDITPGSPLNSKPSVSAPTISTPTINSPAIKMEQTPTTKVATAPGMNPPHGEPGHVCGTPVGSPLNGSKSPIKSSIAAAADSAKN